MSNKNSVSYRRVGDYNIPNLMLPPEEASIRLGKWGILHKDYLLKHKKVVFIVEKCRFNQVFNRLINSCQIFIK